MINNKKKSNRRMAQVLLVATFIVSSPRFLGLFAAVIGIDLVQEWPLFSRLEIASGLPAALLEGVVLAYLSNTWKNLLNRNYPRNFYWYTLLVGQIIMVIMVPSIITPYLFAVQFNQSVAETLPEFMLWIWTFAVAALNPVMAVAVGLIEDDVEDNVEVPERFSKRAMASAIMMDNPSLSPNQLADELSISVEDAGKLLAQIYGSFNYKSNGN